MTHDELLAIIERASTHPCEDCTESLFNALRAVVELPEKKAKSPYVLTQRDWGYNQALTDVRQAITNRLGVE